MFPNHANQIVTYSLVRLGDGFSPGITFGTLILFAVDLGRKGSYLSTGLYLHIGLTWNKDRNSTQREFFIGEPHLLHNMSIFNSFLQHDVDTNWHI